MYYQRPLVFRIVESLCRHWRLFACTAITIVALLALFVVTRPHTYNTQYTVVLNSDSIQNPLSADSEVIDYNVVPETINHFETLIQTKEFIQSALTSPNGAPIPLNHPINFNNQVAVQNLQKSATAWPEGTDSFVVGMTYSDPADSVTILKSLIDAYIDRNASEKSAFYTSQVQFISGQVTQYEDKLAKAEAAYTAFKMANAQHLPSQQDAIEAQLVTLQQNVQQDQVTLAEDQSRASFLAQQLATTPKTIIGSQTSGSSPLQDRLRALQVELDTDLSVKGMKETHPAVRALQIQISNLASQIKKQAKAGGLDASGISSTETEQNPQYFQLASGLQNLKSDIQGLQTEISQTQALIAQTQIGVAKVPEEERIESNLERDYSYDNEQYGLLYKRLQEANMQEQLYLRGQRSMYDIYLTEPPTSSTSKSKTLLLFVGGLLLALIASGAMVLLSEAMDRSFRDPYDMQRTLGVPVLAMLPESPDLHVADSRHPQLPGRGQLARLAGGGGAALLTGSGGAASEAAASSGMKTGKAHPSGYGSESTSGIGGVV